VLTNCAPFLRRRRGYGGQVEQARSAYSKWQFHAANEVGQELRKRGVARGKREGTEREFGGE